jgi:hypothetical protein
MQKILSNKWFWNLSCLAVAILTFDATPPVFGSIPVIEINSDITVNQVWNNKTVYHVTAVSLKASLVIEPGTTVINGPNGGLFVEDGGTLIAQGTPDKPIIFTPDVVWDQCPDSIGYYWQIIPMGSSLRRGRRSPRRYGIA